MHQQPREGRKSLFTRAGPAAENDEGSASMDEATIRDVCTICAKEGRVVEAVVTIRVEYTLLPGRGITHDGLLMQNEALHSCTGHVPNVANIAKLAINSATRRFQEAVGG